LFYKIEEDAITHDPSGASTTKNSNWVGDTLRITWFNQGV